MQLEELRQELAKCIEAQAGMSPDSLSLQCLKNCERELKTKINQMKGDQNIYKKQYVTTGSFEGSSSGQLSATKIREIRGSSFVAKGNTSVKHRPDSSSQKRLLDLNHKKIITTAKKSRQSEVDPPQQTSFCDTEIPITDTYSFEPVSDPIDHGQSSFTIAKADIDGDFSDNRNEDVETFGDVQDDSCTRTDSRMKNDTYTGYNPCEIASLFFNDNLEPRDSGQALFDFNTQYPGDTVSMAPLLSSFGEIFPVDGFGWSMEDMKSCIMGLIGTVIIQNRSLLRLQSRTSVLQQPPSESKIIGSKYIHLDRFEGLTKLVTFPPYQEAMDAYELARKACEGIPANACSSTANISSFVNSFWFQAFDPYYFVTASQGNATGITFAISGVLRDCLTDLVIVGLGLRALPDDRLEEAITVVRTMINKFTNTSLSTAKNQYRSRKSRFAVLRSDFPEELNEGKTRSVDALRNHLFKLKPWK